MRRAILYWRHGGAVRGWENIPALEPVATHVTFVPVPGGLCCVETRRARWTSRIESMPSAVNTRDAETGVVGHVGRAKAQPAACRLSTSDTGVAGCSASLAPRRRSCPRHSASIRSLGHAGTACGKAKGRHACLHGVSGATPAGWAQLSCRRRGRCRSLVQALGTPLRRLVQLPGTVGCRGQVGDLEGALRPGQCYRASTADAGAC